MVVTVVVVFNFALALFLLYLAWQVRQFQIRLARIADALIACDQNVSVLLHGAPDAIYIGKQGIQQLRRGQEPLQLQRMRQFVLFLGIAQQIWRRSSWRFSSPIMRRKGNSLG